MIGIVVQARGRSISFPNKIYTKLNGRTVLQRTLDGVCDSRMAHKIILAMGDEDRADIKRGIEVGDYSRAVSHRGFSVYCGESEDVLQRFYDAAGINGLDLIVRVKGDCPFIQVDVIDDMLMEYLKCGYNGYMTNKKVEHGFNNVMRYGFPAGLRVEIFPWWLLVDAQKDSKERVDFEEYMKRGAQHFNTADHYRGETLDLQKQSEVERFELLAREYDKDKDLLGAIDRIK